MNGRTARAACCLLASCAALHPGRADAQQPLSIIDVPYVSQTEALCGGAAAAMVLRFWGARDVSAESFAGLVDRSASGIRTDVLTADLRARAWDARAAAGDQGLLAGQLARGRPVIALIEDRPEVLHYVVLVAVHERGVVFHDPAAAPFRVMGSEEFDRRWSASGRWMLIVLPGTAPAAAESPPASAASATPPEGECDVLVAEGVRAAQENQLDAAERTLVSALGCPGAAAFRELAGVRLLQQRWADVTAAAETAVRIAPDDTHAWRLLGAGRYLQDERLGALEAWNHAGEPRVDLVRIDNLSRTRHRVVERSIGVEAGEVLTTASFRRAQRRLSEVPAFAAARLQFQPVPEGQVELQGAVTERQLLPGSAFSWAVFGMTTAALREVRLAAASPTGGGEALTVGWRFHPNRPRVTLGLLTPTPWGGGVWGAMAAVERQEFDTEGAVAARRATALATLSDWVSSSVRWELRGGVDRWRDLGRFATAGGALTLLALDDRARAVLRGAGWFGSERFGTGELQFSVLSSRTRRGFVASISGAAQLASEVTPLDLWFGGDTGLARQPALRAHPMLDGGRLRVERLGRSFVGLTAEAQHWWPQTGRLQTAAALFVDTGRTALRAGLHPRTDTDVGLGVRFGVAGVSGTFRADVAKGLRDGATALSFFYTP